MNNKSTKSYLSSHAFFKGLDTDFINHLANSASSRQIKKDEILFNQADHADKFYLLRSGQISIQIPAIMGPVLEIQVVGEGQILGWSWMIPPYRWNFQARALEDSELLEFDGKAILAHCEEDPKFGYELLKRFTALMSERLSAARQKMMDQWNPEGFA